MPLMAISLLTSCAPTKYKVVFDSDGGSEVPTQEVEANKTAIEPDAPSKEPTTELTFKFEEWQLDGIKYDFTTPVTQDITLKAKWTSSPRLYTVTFNTEGGTVVDPQEVEYGGHATRPADPTRESTAQYNYEFEGWYKNNGGIIEKEKFDFENTEITADTTIVANWTNILREYTVTFDSDGGTEVESQTKQWNEKVDRPKNPTRQPSVSVFYTFDSWHKKNGSMIDQQPYNFDSPVVGDIELVAIWNSSIRSYYVTFDSNGGDEDPPKQVVLVNNYAIKPEEDPTRSETDIYTYEFDGWHKNNGGIIEADKFDFENTPIVEDTLLEAVWIKRSKKYALEATGESHLKFIGADKRDPLPSEIYAGTDFHFCMYIERVTNKTEYKVPTSLDIEVKGKKIPRDAYTITETESSFEADVVIQGEYIVGNVQITGEGVDVTYYRIEMHCFGVDHNLETEYALIDEKLDIKFLQEQSYSLPVASDILVKIDGQDWINPSSESQSPVSFDNYNTLTIKGNVASNAVIVFVRTNIPLNDMSWDDIALISNEHLADRMCSVGETKEVKLFENGKEQEFSHKVRIIDFNHNELSVSTKESDRFADFTFEFANILTNSDGSTIEKKWCKEDHNRCYIGGEIQKYLDGNFYSSVIPESLKSNIRPVKIYCDKRKEDDWYDDYYLKEHESYFFPLAVCECANYQKDEVPSCELDEDYIRPYAYYSVDLSDNSRRLKAPAAIGSETPENKFYATRTPEVNDYPTSEPNDVMYISKSGKPDFDKYCPATYEFPMAPVFCI